MSFDKKKLKIYIGIFISIFNSAFSITMLFPFLPFMVEFLVPQIDPASIGKYAGIIASSMFFGSFIGSYIWGMLSDSWGRRPVLIISTILLGLSSLSFGFSVNFAMAVCTRFMVGLTNGLAGTIKAVLSESSTDETQPIGLSILATAFGVGIIIGPAVSGAIADPISQYNLNITNAAVRNFLTQFPYSLPGIINFLLCILAIFYLITLFPETLQKKKSSEKMESHDQFSETSVSSDANHTHTSTMNEKEFEDIKEESFINQDNEERLIDQDDDQERLINQDDDQERLIDHDKQKTTKFTMVWFMKKISFRSGLIKAFKNLKFFFKNPVTRLVLIIYCIYSFAVIGFDEVYSLWCATPGYLGGLGFSHHEIGISLSIVGALLLPFTLFFYPFIERKMGSINTFYLMTMIQIFFTLLLPSIHYLTTLDQSLVLWFILCTVMLVIKITIGVDFAITSLFINNSVTFDKVGAINGLATSMTSLFRCVSPIFAGSIFSVSLSLTSKNIGYLIDYHLIYIILGIILLITLIMATRLPNSINRQKSVLEDIF